MASELSTDLSASSRLEPYLPRLVRSWPEGDDDRAWRAVDGTLVSVDISGFTRLSERLAGRGRAGTEELLILLDSCFRGLISIAERHDGDVLKFRGDALLVLFASAGHARRACEAAAQMQDFIEGMGQTPTSVGTLNLRMATGVHSGTCHFFMVGSTHRELIITGPAATETVALEKVARAGQVIVSAATADALDGRWLGPRRNGARLLRRGAMAALPIEAKPVEQAAERDLTRFIPTGLREAIGTGEAEGEHRQVTAAFVRFTGTDALVAAKGLDDVADRLQRLAEVVDVVTARLGVVWLESDIAADGGALYLTAGAPSTSGADEERMLRAARAIMDSELAVPIAIGMNRGSVFAGDIGGPTRRTYAVMGDPVNLAARLMQRAAPGQILVTADVITRSGWTFESTPLEPFSVKGKRQAVTAHELGRATRRSDRRRRSEPGFLGREVEVAVMMEALASAKSGAGRLVEIVGEPGVGKSALVDQLLASAEDCIALASAGEQYESSTPYFAFQAILRALAGIDSGAGREEAGTRLTDWVQVVAPDLAPWLPLIAIPFDAAVPSSPEVDETAPAFRETRLQHAIAELLAVAVTTPAVLVFEDAHWLDSASSDLVRLLAEQVADRPWLLCVTRRPDGAGVSAAVADAGIAIVLEPLSPDETFALVVAAAEHAALPEDLLVALSERSGGNPLFIRELVAAARAEDFSVLPESVEAVITTRIDTLPKDDRRLVRYAAVVGPTFDVNLLGAILAGDVGPIAELSRWDRLGEFLEWDGPETLRFRHDLFRAVAYEGLSYQRKRLIHARVAEVLEGRAESGLQETAALLSLHFVSAERYDKAWHYAVVAGEQARSQFANAAAAELFQRALDAAARLPVLEPVAVAQVAEAMGDVSELVGRYDLARVAYRHAARLPTDDAVMRSRLMMKQGILRERSGSYAGALRWYGRALSNLKQTSEPGDARALKVELELAYAGVRYRQGRFAETIRWATAGAHDAEAVGHRSGLAHAYYLLDAAYTDLGRPEATEYRERSLPIYEEIGDLIGQANVLNNLGIDAYYEGRWNEALTLYARSRVAKEQAGDIVNTAMQTNNEAEILSDQGHLAEAERLFRVALRVWGNAGYALAPVIKGNLGRVAARTGRFDDAHRLLQEALDSFERIGADAFVLETRARIAECFVLQGRPERAAAVLSEIAVEAGRVAGVSVLQAFLERLRGYVALQTGDGDRARTHFVESVRIATELAAEYETALALEGLEVVQRIAGSSDADDHGRRRSTIFERLGVVATPAVPVTAERVVDTAGKAGTPTA